MVLTELHNMKITNIRVDARLGTGFAIVLILLAASIGLGLPNIEKIEDALLQITQKVVRPQACPRAALAVGLRTHAGPFAA